MVDWIKNSAYFLAGLGALNAGFVTWFNFNLVDTILGSANSMWGGWLFGIAGGYVLLELFGVLK